MRYPVAETARAEDQFQPLRCGGVGAVVALMSPEPFVDILVATGLVRAAVVVVGYNVGVWAV
jgi:hypothetical protein